MEGRDPIAAAWSGVRSFEPMKPGAPQFDDLFSRETGSLARLVAAHASERPRHLALIQDDATIDYRELDWRADRVAASLLRDGIGKGDVAAICAASSIDNVVVYLGALRAGATVAPLASSSTARSLATMIEDCGPKILFLDDTVSETLGPVLRTVHARLVSLDGSSHAVPLDDWFCPEWMRPSPIETAADDPFDIIYRSGGTIGSRRVVRPHAMRWYRFKQPIYGGDAVTMVSMPLHSDTALAGLLSTLASGGTVVLMARFDAGEFLRNAALQRATHATLFPSQYLRIMRRPDFDGYDLESFRMKFSTSAPSSAELMADVLKRWPGGLMALYGTTKGGGSCVLEAHTHPDKLHSVGRPMSDSDVRVIDAEGTEVRRGGCGHVVGRSRYMPVGLREREEPDDDGWVSPEGLRFVRTGDIGAFDADGFLVLKGCQEERIAASDSYPMDPGALHG